MVWCEDDEKYRFSKRNNSSKKKDVAQEGTRPLFEICFGCILSEWFPDYIRYWMKKIKGELDQFDSLLDLLDPEEAPLTMDVLDRHSLGE